MVTITSSRVIRETVDVVVGESNTVGSERTENDVLTGNVVGGDMVNPDHIGVVNGDSVTSPDVFGVDLLDLDVPRSLMLVRIFQPQRL